MLLVIMVFYGVPIKAQPTIKIGVVGPDGWIQWDGIWEAAVMARDKINGEGGILGQYDVELFPINSHAVELDPAAGIAEMLTALDAGVQFLIGGFRTEVVLPMREAAMTYAKDYGRPIWWIAGAATDQIIDCGGGALACGKCVRCDYETWKYMFRVTPMNSTILGKQIFMFLRFEVLPKLATVYESPVKTYIIGENLEWNDRMIRVLAGSDWYPEIMPGVSNPYPSPPKPGSVLGETAVVVGVEKPSALATDFSAEFSRAEADKARLIIHIFSAVAGPPFIKQYGELQVPAVCVGINVESQMQEFWTSVEEKCEYESFLASVGTKTPIVPGVTDKFWDDYLARWDHAPVYTAWGAYDGIMALKETIEAAGTWPMTCDEMIPLIETSERLGILGTFKYTGVNGKYHDVYCDPYCAQPTWPEPRYVRSHITQWQAGRLEPIWPADQAYSKKYALPTWMYPYSDVNYDGNIDIFDIVTTAGAFGTLPGDNSWDIRADVIKSDGIDIFDIVKIAGVFGTSVPLPVPYPS